MEQINRLKEEIDKLKNENELLRERKDRLEVQLEEYIVGKDEVQGRVIHLAENPLSKIVTQRENEMEKLQEEVSFLN